MNISQNIKEKTINIRKEFNFKLPDSLIIASALENNTILVTSDKQLL
ncbi:PIN domain-containing protein [Aliarcobacter faecis]